MLQSRFSIGIACSRSSAFPCGTPSITSSSTTSANSFAAIQCAAVAPTLPEPTTVTFFRIPSLPSKKLVSLIIRLHPRKSAVDLHVFNHPRSKFARLSLRRALHSALEVICDELLRHRLLHRAFNQSRCLSPTQKVKKQYARQHHRTWIDHVFVRILRCRAMGRLKHRIAIANVATRSDPQPSDLRGRDIGNVVAVKVRRRQNAI